MAQASQLVQRFAAAVWGGTVPLQAAEGEGFGFLVDGVRIAVQPQGPRVRLQCLLGQDLPAEEGAARALLAAFLLHADAGPEVLCADTSGRVLLIADLEPEAEAEPAIARFADAAVHWTRRFAGAAEVPSGRPMPTGPILFFP